MSARAAPLALAPLLAILVLAVLALAPAGGARAATVRVRIAGYAFVPARVHIHPGDTVVWTNRDPATHTVTAVAGGFDSGALGPGRSYRRVFPAAGSFAYRCALHPEMRGVVIVGAPP